MHGRQPQAPTQWQPVLPQTLLQASISSANTICAWWQGDGDQASVFLHAYESQWLPATLLEPAQRGRLVDALVAAAQFQAVELHINKGLAGAPPEVNEQARQCAMNPKVADAFGLMIVATGRAPPFAGVPIAPPDMAQAHRDAESVAKAAAILKALSPQSGSYVSETDFFREDWREAFWGVNYARLKTIKDRYDPEGFFFVHHGVGSEDWSHDGFTPVRHDLYRGEHARPYRTGRLEIEQERLGAMFQP